MGLTAGLSPAMTAETMLHAFVASYQAKVGSEERAVFGIRVEGPGGGAWQIRITGGCVTLHPELPDTPTFIYATDLATLRRIYRGELNALTAAGRARTSDPAPLELRFMDGVDPTAVMGQVLHYGFHFFLRSHPERVRFGDAYSRRIHGGNAVVLYYAKGLRTAWYQLQQGMVVNREVRDQVNPFPTLLICTRGEGYAQLGGQTVPLSEGLMVYIPAGMTHTVWNDRATPVECIIIMFGEGA